jgi:hypothetical protein
MAELGTVRSVLQDWVMELPLREQGTLMTGVRGCDLTPKQPLDSTERKLVAFLRYTFFVPADDREVDVPGGFYASHGPDEWRASELGHYPLHWVMHLMHCFEVITYRHPDPVMAHEAGLIYFKLVKSFHLKPESRDEMIKRLSEDRIATGEIVS